MGPHYIQHNPDAPDGAEGLKGFIQFLRDKFPRSHNEVKRVLTDGDYVILHVHSVREPGTIGRVIGEIFRLDQGKVVEHWDVIHPITNSPDPHNANWVF
jgi:predicted SnoaL-like aldol condensation-catalyzing enzyme